ncbi:hypothetical protein LEP1GSC059_0524 [Leptospira noguchii serovar Panama str. CZ214]|uniref:Uncharacterized protein n=1 Tax=Leptospira noguchii serovar Panama str. CZ214 TaxID=1001595 RepID=T0H236_9LEPT|nr:hypothetical protein LEP1GSC059_0524 [Leptospira noguchii serovar Panama str. CZ214]
MDFLYRTYVKQSFLKNVGTNTIFPKGIILQNCKVGLICGDSYIANFIVKFKTQ